MKYECRVCGDKTGDKERFGQIRKPWGWEQGSCPRHVTPCPECGEVRDLVRTGCAFGCEACDAIWVKQTTMLSAPLFDPGTITTRTLVVTPAVYKSMRQGCAKFDVQCVKLQLPRRRK